MQVVLKITIATLIFAIGMSATPADIAYVWKRPLLLCKSLLAMYVVVPVVAISTAAALDLPHGTRIALVVLGICAGAPLLPKKIAKTGGNPTFMLSLVVATSLLAVITVPVGLEVVGRFVELKSDVTSREIAATIVRTFLLPLSAGMLLRLFAPETVERAGARLFQWASGALVVCAAVLIVAGFRLLLDVGLESILALAFVTGAGIAAGHLLGGPDPGDRTALAIACASRHIGLALVIAANYRHRRALELVAGYLFASALVSIPYLRSRAEATKRSPTVEHSSP